MAKKGVVIFDGEDMFINPKKAIYSKTRGEARNASFMSARGDDGPGEEESPSDDGPMGRERIMREGTSGGGSQAPSAPPATAPPIVDEPIAQQIQAPAQKKTAVEPDTITIKGPIAEIPTIVVPPILPPNYIAPTPDVPTRPTPPQRPGSGLDDDFIAKRPGDDGSGGRYSGPDNNPGLNTTPIYTIDDGTPAKQVIDTPRYVAPVPVLPAAPTPPPAIVIPDPMGGGGSPLLGKDPEIPKINCPTGFTLSLTTGRCIPIPVEVDDIIVGPGSGAPGTPRVDPCAFPPVTPLVANHEWKKTGDCTWEQIPIPSTSTTDTTTTKKDEILTPATDPCAGLRKPQLAQPPAGQKWVQDKKTCLYELVDDGTGVADKVEETTTTSSTTTTTTKKSKNCNPPIYAAPKFYKWVDKGNCTFELAVDTTQVPNPSPAPVLPAVNGQPIININLPTGGLGTVPTTPTTAPTVELPVSDSGGASGGGGGGGTPFPEEPAPVVEEAPKKNYFWWYVGGALAVYLLIKRKKSQ
jgi:hypothetical protein